MQRVNATPGSTVDAFLTKRKKYYVQPNTKLKLALFDTALGNGIHSKNVQQLINKINGPMGTDLKKIAQQQKKT